MSAEQIRSSLSYGLLAYPLLTAGVVESGIDRGDGVTGTYPLTATSMAAQLVTDEAVVAGHLGDIVDGVVVLNQTGTLEAYAALAPGDVRKDTPTGPVGVVGTLKLPVVGKVELEEGYGAAGTEFVGTMVPFTPASTTTPAATDFGPGLFLDMRLKAAFPMAGMALASTWQGVMDAVASGSPQIIVAGGEDGYLYQALAQDAGGLGTPMTRTQFTVATWNAGSKIVTIDEADDLEFPANSLLTNLPLVIRYAATGVEETLQIASNGATSLILTASPAHGTPTAGDTFWVAPMDCGVLFSEVRYEYAAHPQTVALDVNNRQPAAQGFTFGIYEDDTRPSIVLDGTPTTVETFTTDDLSQGRGSVGLENLVSRSFAYELGFRPVGGGLLQVGPIKVEEFVDSRERTRST